MDLAYMVALPQEEFAERRQKVLAQMQPNSALLLFSEIEKRKMRKRRLYFFVHEILCLKRGMVAD